MSAGDRAPDYPHPRYAPLSLPHLRSASVWAIAQTACFFIVYGGCAWLTLLRDRHNPASVGTFYFSWERSIPFVGVMILPYMSIDLLFFFAPFLCIDRRQMDVHGRRVLLAIGLAAVCFLLFPMKMGPGFTHPPVGRLYAPFYALLGGFDRPYNLIPSLHVALRSILLPIYAQYSRGFARILLHGWFVLIVLSALLTWQHHLIDLAAGQALAIVCMKWLPLPTINDR
jgi:membrane-associated phospholipid phosphatase